MIVLVVAVAAGGAVFANAALGIRYSAGQAALDYFAAQKKGDAAGMAAVATFLHGPEALDQLFDSSAVAGMLRTSQNTDLRDVKVLSVQSVDSNTSKVHMSMTWAGVSRGATYTVRRDSSQTHFLVYNTWRVDVPYTTISVDLPNQPGALHLDGVLVAAGTNVKSLEAIAAYHSLTMDATTFYDQSTKVVNGVDGFPAVTMDGHISDAAKAAAAAAIKDALNNHCDAARYVDCPGHTYTAPNDGQVWYLTLPGYPEIDYKSYLFAFSSDPTANMKVVVTAERNKMTASAACAMTLTVDGSRTYSFTGTWTATLSWNGSSFVGTDVTYACDAATA